jgi:hypothetical protein
MIAGMARFIALARTATSFWQLETLRLLTVCSCALALIAAGPALSF